MDPGDGLDVGVGVGVGVGVEMRVVRRQGDGEGCGHLLEVNGLKAGNWIKGSLGLKDEGEDEGVGEDGAGEGAQAKDGAGDRTGAEAGTAGVGTCVQVQLVIEDECVGLG